MTVEKTFDRGSASLGKVETLGSLRLRHHETNEIILIPTPSNDPNDPLNWCVSRSRTYLISGDCEAHLIQVCCLPILHRRACMHGHLLLQLPCCGPNRRDRGYYYIFLWTTRTEFRCQHIQSCVLFHINSLVARHGQSRLDAYHR